MSEKFNESLDIIGELLEIISWLGGDSYEVESTEKGVSRASEFFNKHKPPKIDIENIPTTDSRLGQYIAKDQPNVIIYAVNKRNAKNKSGRMLKDIKCIKQPSF